MGKIVAIGGGEMGRPGYPVETTIIDKEIIRLTGKTNPHLLFLPTASSDSESYYEVVKKHFGDDLGCKTDVLYLIKEKPNIYEIESKIMKADVIYVGGGNTQKMIRVWKQTGSYIILKQAYDQGTVISGLSAGANCWFRWGKSDSRKVYNPNSCSIKVSGLNLVKALCCPHYNTGNDKRMELKKMMMKTPGIALAFDNCCAIEIIDEQYRILSSNSTAHAYKVYWRASNFHEDLITEENVFKPLKELLIK
jgi:dipeptidase E